MDYLKEFCILLLLIDFVDTSVVSEVTCTADGDVYILSGGRERGMLSEGVTLAYAASENAVCTHEQLRDMLRIYGCQMPSPVSAVDVYLRTGAESLLIVEIQCITDQPRRQLNHSVSSSSPDLRRHQLGPGILTYDFYLRHRRQDIQSGEDPLAGKVKNMKTSVSFEVKLNFSSNDEISIACDPEGMGILYISNPNPDLFQSLLAFSEFTKKKCNTQFYDNGRIIAIGGCNLDMPVIASFSVQEKHASFIGGTLSNFKVYNINCSDPETGRGRISPALYEPDSGEAGNHQHERLVAMSTAVVSMAIVIWNLF